MALAPVETALFRSRDLLWLTTLYFDPWKATEKNRNLLRQLRGAQCARLFKLSCAHAEQLWQAPQSRGICMSIKSRLKRLEEAVAKRQESNRPPDAEISDKEFAEELGRFLDGESLESIAKSKGRAWKPWKPTPGGGGPQSQEEEDAELRMSSSRVRNVTLPPSHDSRSTL
jgi:hypothetical protein